MLEIAGALLLLAGIYLGWRAGGSDGFALTEGTWLLVLAVAAVALAGMIASVAVQAGWQVRYGAVLCVFGGLLSIGSGSLMLSGLPFRVRFDRSERALTAAAQFRLANRGSRSLDNDIPLGAMIGDFEVESYIGVACHGPEVDGIGFKISNDSQLWWCPGGIAESYSIYDTVRRVSAQWFVDFNEPQ